MNRPLKEIEGLVISHDQEIAKKRDRMTTFGRLVPMDTGSNRPRLCENVSVDWDGASLREVRRYSESSSLLWKSVITRLVKGFLEFIGIIISPPLRSGHAMNHNPMESCPRCGSVQHVRPKGILIGAASPKKRFNGEEKAGYQRLDQLAVDECKPALLKAAPLEQLVDGFYCDHCGVGFVTSEIVQGVD
ncbi:hypothetical protein [Pseudomonas ogarae]|uniref:hypothetical protein n=1 Tax=Pseudomonas ogarae (strain DSM 112162 / CECT 30235 / F113) TaxID=1114970 RepID=UPI00114181A5|nr:hypothetical protein [Pseudomonas ogarae]